MLPGVISLILVILRMTESVNVCTLLLNSGIGKTSLLMFPVYGLAALIRPAYDKFSHFPVMIRGIFYTCGIFLVEFLSGSFFRKLHICPWDYSHVPFQYKGVIRLDYAPLWFLTGLFFEWLLRQNTRKSS